MPSLSTSPIFPPPGKEIQVRFTLTGSGANFVRAWVTAAPPGSELRAKLDKTTQNRFPVYTGDGGTGDPWRVKFDLGGKYTLVAQEYVRGASAAGGGYQDSPGGNPSETKVGSETTLSIYLGQRMTSDVGVGSDKVTLVLWVFDTKIQETSLAVHGEASPAIVPASATPRVQTIIETAAVDAALLELRNATVSTAAGSATTVLGDIIAKWNLHLVAAGVHEAADSDNDIPLGLSSAASAANLQDAVGAILPLIRYHYTNDPVLTGATSGRDAASYHNVSGKKNDNGNMPLVTGVSGLGDAYWALADLWRSYEAHRVSTAVHDAADTTDALDALPLLLQVALQIFTVLASTSPTVPATQSAGAMTLISAAGFAETPL